MTFSIGFYYLSDRLGMELSFLWKVPEQKCWPETSLFLEKYEYFLGPAWNQKHIHSRVLSFWYSTQDESAIYDFNLGPKLIAQIAWLWNLVLVWYSRSILFTLTKLILHNVFLVTNEFQPIFFLNILERKRRILIKKYTN